MPSMKWRCQFDATSSTKVWSALLLCTTLKRKANHAQREANTTPSIDLNIPESRIKRGIRCFYHSYPTPFPWQVKHYSLPITSAVAKCSAHPWILFFFSLEVLATYAIDAHRSCFSGAVVVLQSFRGSVWESSSKNSSSPLAGAGSCLLWSAPSDTL